LSDKKSPLDKKYITVYFGSFYINGYVEFDLDDRIIVSDKEGDSTVIFRSAISAITVHQEEPKNDEVESEVKPFLILSSKKQNAAKQELDFNQSENKYDSGMYIPESVLSQDPLNINIHHTDDFSVSFGGRANIDFTSEE